MWRAGQVVIPHTGAIKGPAVVLHPTSRRVGRMVLALAAEVLGGFIAIGAVAAGVFFAAVAVIITWELWAQRPIVYGTVAMLVVGCAIWLLWTSMFAAS